MGSPLNETLDSSNPRTFLQTPLLAVQSLVSDAEIPQHWPSAKRRSRGKDWTNWTVARRKMLGSSLHCLRTVSGRSIPFRSSYRANADYRLRDSLWPLVALLWMSIFKPFRPIFRGSRCSPPLQSVSRFLSRSQIGPRLARCLTVTSSDYHRGERWDKPQTMGR
ncbi:uncharacterized protein LOC143183442 [Calliopsis andreniformis]|uniref:uncharacterized protein LOC143183442 n=1 Tax=Calliopsis andreniformis TaxID=337506 RepID=UPI003FCD91EE